MMAAILILLMAGTIALMATSTIHWIVGAIILFILIVIIMIKYDVDLSDILIISLFSGDDD